MPRGRVSLALSTRFIYGAISFTKGIKMFITALLFSTFAASHAQAAPSVSKDWTLDSCVASTSLTDKTGTYRLEVAIDPTHTMPLEVRIVPSITVAGARIVIDKKTVYAFAPEANGTLWNIPRGTLDLIKYLKREAKAAVDLNGVKIAFSLRGSTTALQALQKTCNGAAEFGSDGFERAFLPAVVANIDPTLLPASQVEVLRGLVRDALAAFRSSANSQVALNALSAQFLAQIAEFEQLHRNLDKLTHETMVGLQKRHDDATANIARAQTEIPQLKTQVAQQEAALQPANTTLEQAKADLAPMRAELQRYQSAVDDAEAEVSSRESALSQAQQYESSTRSRLQDAINGIAQSSANITTLQNQIASRRNDWNNANSQAEQLRRSASDATSTRQRFDRNYEVQRRLQSDSRLSSIEFSLRDAQSRLPGAQDHISQAEADRSRFAGEYSQCQTVVGRDCSRERDLADRAELRLTQASNEFRDLQSHIRDLENQRDNFRSTIESEVNRDYDDLVRQEREAQTRADRATADANSIVNEINRMQSIDLPQAQANLSAWQNARAQADADVRSAMNGTAVAQRNLENARSGVDAAAARRDSWRQSSGYNAKAHAVSAAQDVVDKINATLSSLDKAIAAREKLIRDETKSLADTEAQMQAALALIQQKEARSAEVQKMLQPYFTQRDVLVAQKNASDAAFASAQSAFAAALQPAVPPAPAPTPAPVAPPVAAK
jgi:predicted  nucleic acid-binding Zn-ribbon protein